jgi:hypothetical protein
MSFLIEMPQVEEQPPEENMHQILLQQLGVLLQHEEFKSAALMRESQDVVVVSLPRGLLAFARDTRWNLELKRGQLRVWVSMLEQSGLNFLRAQSERMKLELMILLRFVNSKLPL